MNLLSLFWTILKINFLTPSGPASIGLLHEECVGKFITPEQFTQAASLSRVLPGSDAIQMAMFIGYDHAGVLGASIALMAAILPPAILITTIFTILSFMGKQAWLVSFFKGVTPALAAVMLYAAYEVWKTGPTNLNTIWIMGCLSFLALTLQVPAPLILVIAGIVGIFIL